MNLKSILTGTGVAIITPFDQKNAVDFAALGKLIDFIIAGGAEYIVTMGTTGETPVISKEEKAEIVKYTYSIINDRVPVIVGIGGNNTQEVTRELETFPLERATAILSASPYYNKPSQEGLYQHYKHVAAASAKPVIMYNVPGRTGRNMTAETTIRLARDIENIGGIKEASGDIAQCMEILRNCPEDFLVVSGDDALALPQIACGMQGVISVAANSFPLEFSEMVRLCLQQDFRAAKKINDRLIPAYQLMFEENNPSGVKAFLYELGLIQNEVRLPVVPLSSTLQQAVKKYVNQAS